MTMSQVATRDDIDEVLTIVRDFMQQVDSRFTNLETKVDTGFAQVDTRIAHVEAETAEIKTEISALKASHNRLLNTIDGFIARIDRYETELAARDSQFERLLAWARKVSEKTGIPLENL